MPQRAHTFKVYCCLKGHSAQLIVANFVLRYICSLKLSLSICKI